MIELKNVTKRFGDLTVLNGITLNLESSKTHVLLGSSGSGKSTIIRILMALTPYQSGEVYIDGTLISPSIQNEIALKVGYVIQEGGLFPHLTNRQNIELSANIFGLCNNTINERIPELCEMVHLNPNALNRYPKEISGGQRQRVALMRALIRRPSVLFLDEPLGALDPIVRMDLQKELKDLFSKLNITVIIVTHDLGEAAYFGHTITLLKMGKVIQHGDFNDLINNPSHEFVKEFLSAHRPVPGLEKLQERDFT